MSFAYENPTTIENVFSLKKSGLGQIRIAKQLGISRTTVRDILIPDSRHRRVQSIIRRNKEKRLQNPYLYSARQIITRAACLNRKSWPGCVITEEYALSILPKDCRCPICRCRFDLTGVVAKRNSLSMDRFDPAVGYDNSNINWMCQGCNLTKGKMSPWGMVEFSKKLLPIYYAHTHQHPGTPVQGGLFLDTQRVAAQSQFK